MKLSAPRYTDRLFPAYRFRPGVHPHPTADPRGHSFHPPDTPPPPAPFLPAERWRESVEYLYGCDLYNHGYWWEAHESWESLWQQTDKAGVQGRFLQAIIQVSAQHLKLEMRRPDGVQGLAASSAGHMEHVLARLPGDLYMGLRVRTWWAAVRAYFEVQTAGPVEAWQHNPRTYPYILLEDAESA